MLEALRGVVVIDGNPTDQYLLEFAEVEYFDPDLKLVATFSAVDLVDSDLDIGYARQREGLVERAVDVDCHCLGPDPDLDPGPWLVEEAVGVVGWLIEQRIDWC